LPGEDLLITLDEGDIKCLWRNGFCIARQGLIGSESKTWIRSEPYIDVSIAEIDGGNDLNVYIPSRFKLPLIIPNESITSPLDGEDRTRINFYFGELSKIILATTFEAGV
jgi:hypothetical protein